MNECPSCSNGREGEIGGRASSQRHTSLGPPTEGLRTPILWAAQEVGIGRLRRSGQTIGLWSLRVSIDQGKVPVYEERVQLLTIFVSCN
jgi:hypothetical protein